MTFNAIKIRDVTFEDIATLCQEGVPESDSIEFKQELPAGGGERWALESCLLERARNKILEEVVAFANAHGGRLIVGISETEDRPARANEITPVPNCHELAERLAHAARDVVMPQIPLITVRGVSAEGESNGCVVLDVQESPLAPHRLEGGVYQCYVRRADRSEKMTMREIQDLTVDRLRGTERVRERLNELAGRIQGAAPDSFCLQIVATPTTARINLPWNAERAAIQPVLQRFRSHGGPLEHSLPVQGLGSVRPILRGWRWQDQRLRPLLSFEIYWDGSVVSEFEVTQHQGDWMVFADWIVSFAANCLNAIDQVRTASEQPDAEYALKFQIQTQGALRLLWYGAQNGFLGTAGEIQSPFYPPVYSVTTRQSFSQLIDDLQRDVFNAVGVDADDIGVQF